MEKIITNVHEEANQKVICKSCKKTFYLHPKEIAFYSKHDLDLPKRCRYCREKRKASRSKDM